jgi:hypothetical protein
MVFAYLDRSAGLMDASPECMLTEIKEVRFGIKTIEKRLS